MSDADLHYPLGVPEIAPTDRVAELREQRGAIYGPPAPNMAGTSQQIAGLLTQMLAAGHLRVVDLGSHQEVLLAPWAAPLIMAAVKLNRAASGVPHADSLDDAAAYWTFALEMQRGATMPETAT